MQGQNAARSLGQVGGAIPTVATLNERMYRVAESIYRLNSRTEGVLARINGTPTAPGSDAAEKIANTPPMTSSLSTIEEQIERLHRLVEGLEQVA